MPMISPALGHKARFAAVAATIGFALFTAWWLVSGGTQLDVTMLRFTGWLLRGWLDIVISSSWPLGEPQFGAAVVACVALLLVARRSYRTAVLIVAGFVVLSALEVVILVILAEVRHVSLGLDALTHLYPSGHTARVPFLGAAVSAFAGRRARGWLLAVTALLAVVVALDRTDSRIQTGSAVVGGLLMGISASLWLVAFLPRLNSESMPAVAHGSSRRETSNR